MSHNLKITTKTLHLEYSGDQLEPVLVALESLSAVDKDAQRKRSRLPLYSFLLAVFTFFANIGS